MTSLLYWGPNVLQPLPAHPGRASFCPEKTMPDAGDRSAMLEEQELERLAREIRAARGIKNMQAETCRECGEPLPEHRRPYGTCVPCQTLHEAAMGRRGWV
jgi:RNA polymerase-binding transcription factor DksA